ncbi:hypothetical protein B1748_28995 [Paenibacillus sp. MY03]|uniref:hypothetical protein n=1 Tax=Paenibacillus sp. MY03 TaxID=302980 RepID=UPI000B3C4D76|nr:hypothetical protein [Paenibacillus sp. MY03]OUS70275.1 hypothetical protein B1748_28995 [Paenibacillus sp. MY03]
MLRGLESLMRDVLGMKEQRTLVGIMTGQLLEDWREYAFQKSRLAMQSQLSIEQFAMEFFERREGEWWNRDDMSERASVAYKSERAAEIVDFNLREEKIDALEKSLWQLTYEAFGLDPEDSHSNSMSTGEVFKIEVKPRPEPQSWR